MPNEFGTLATSYFWDIDSVGVGWDSLAVKLDSIESLETIASNNLSGYQLAFVQICASIARYSLSYWASSDTTLWAGWQAHQRAIVNGQGRPKGERPAGLFADLMVDLGGAAEGAIEWDGLWGAGAPGWIMGATWSLASGIADSASG